MSRQLSPSSIAAKRGLGKKIEAHIINRGGTAAHIETCEVSVYWEGIDPNITIAVVAQHKWGPSLIEAGDIYTFTLQVPKPDHFRGILRTAEGAVAGAKKQYAFPVCQGFISYRDGNGCSYDIAFDRNWDIETQRFVPGDDPESEYSD